MQDGISYQAYELLWQRILKGSDLILNASAGLKFTSPVREPKPLWKELDAALAYFDKLKPSCVDSGVSFEDRVARRKEEIESLQEALKILNGEDIA